MDRCDEIEIIDLRREGNTMREIEKKTGWSLFTIHSILKPLGLTKKVRYE